MAKLDEYMKDPNSMPTDDESVEALIAELGEEPVTETTETDETAGQDDKAAADDTAKAEADAAAEIAKADQQTDEAAKAEAAQEEAAKEEAQKVILTRDGKHEIPYSILENERKRSATLQRELDELRAKREQAQTEQATAQPQVPGTSADTDELDLEAYREEFGEKAAKAEQARRRDIQLMREKQQALEKELEENKAWRKQQEDRSRDAEVNSVNEAIDSITELREWREKQDPMWDAAIALDNRLMNDPAFQDMSLRERFEVVVQRLTGKAIQKDNPNLEADVDAKLAEKEKSQRSAPNSLSDLPGGVTTDQSESDAVDRMSVGQLENKLARMTPEEQDAFLARL